MDGHRAVLLEGHRAVLDRVARAGVREVVTATDGPEALQAVKAERPYVVLLDIRLPRMKGLEVLRQLRTIDLEARVIRIAGVAEPETARVALQLGATDSSMKPIDLVYLEQSPWHTATPMTL